jgi:hypothetical protein
MHWCFGSLFGRACISNSGPNWERPNFWGLTAALILNVWTRLDAALLSATLFTFYIGMLVYAYRSKIKIFFESYNKVIVGCILLAGFALIGQMAAFKVMGDSFLPVSAIVKTSGTGWALEKDRQRRNSLRWC